MNTKKMSHKTNFCSILLSHLNQSIIVELKGKSYKTFVRGGKEEDYLIVDIPTRLGVDLPFLKNEQCVVRFMQGGIVFGFVTSMKKEMKEPVALLILAYPQHIEEVNLRRSERLDIFISVDILKEGKGTSQHIEGYMVDLSANGCRIVVQDFTDFFKGEDLGLSFIISPGGDIDNLQSFIKHTVVNEESIQLRIKFYEHNKEFLEKIENFIHSCGRIREKFSA